MWRTILLSENIMFSDNVLMHIIIKLAKNNRFAIHAIQQHSMNPKITNLENWIIDYDDFHFYKLFRMVKQTFQLLLEAVGKTDVNGLLKKPYRGGHYPIRLESQLLIFLWYMATQDTLLSIATRFKISPTTVMSVVNKLLYFGLKLKKIYIKFPNNLVDLNHLCRGFLNYPGTVGALDGSHIYIKVSEEHQESYIDRYRRLSINLMAICDKNKIFTYIFVGFPGSAHDSRVFHNSAFYKHIEHYGPNVFMKSQKFHLIGDSTFAIKTWLMTPYKGNNLTAIQKYHNLNLSKDRVAIEHAFGLLKGRWRRLQFINTYHICKSIEIATVACVLHNFCILKNDFWTEDYVDFEQLENGPFVNTLQREGTLKRDQIANELFYNQYL